MDDKLKDPITTLNESNPEYYTDMYSAWEVKEQLIIGQEVAEKSIATGTIDTNDALLTKVDNIYRLSVSDPTGKIFSMTINWLSKTFQNTSGYTELETALQTWLWVDYIVDYDTGTFFNLSRVDWQVITYSNPSLVRNVDLTNTPDNWNIHSKIDVIIDSVTYTLDGIVYSDSISVLNALVVSLTGSTYFVKRETTKLVIARQDGAIPTISKTQYNRYTYSLQGRDNSIWPTSADLWWSGGGLPAKAYRSRVTFNGTTYLYNLASGITWSAVGNAYDSPNFAGSPNWTIDNRESRWSGLIDIMYTALTSYNRGTFSYTWGTWPDYNILNFTLYRTDRTSISMTAFSIDYVKDSGLGIVTRTDYVWLNLTEINQLADITVTTYTEISKTFTTLSNNYFIKTGNIPNTIRITAKSSVWDSTGEYKRREQSCTAKYSTTTEVVADKIFKTNASNYGNIVIVKRGGFVINWTTNTSNKLDYVCE